MRFVHTADTHLGFEITARPKSDLQGRKIRADSILRNFLAVVQHATDIQADLFIHSGDLFNKHYLPRNLLDEVNPEWPNLAGQHAQYIAKQLRAFKSGARDNPLMTPMAMALSDQDIEDVAAYFASQASTGLEADSGKVALGQRLFRGGESRTGLPACSGCHGPSGDGNHAAAYPAIKGQHATYVAAQLRAYRAGTRQNDPNQIMRNVASTMSDGQIDAVASYVQGLR